MSRSSRQVETGKALARTHRTEERWFPDNVAQHASEVEALPAKARVAYRGEYARTGTQGICFCHQPWKLCPVHKPKNVLDRTEKPSPRRHTGPLKDLLLGILIGAGLMLGCFALGWLQVWLGF